MERLRDFMYDISDLLISLLIIAAIFAVISWKLNESIPIETASSLPAVEAEAAKQEAEPAQAVTDAEAPLDASDADKPIAEQPVTEVSQAPVQTPVDPKPVDPKPAAPAAGTAVTIEIPSGSPGVAIGKILKDSGLITDVNTFIQKVDELGLGPKLRSGSFKLKTGMSLEQIIKTLANVN